MKKRRIKIAVGNYWKHISIALTLCFILFGIVPIVNAAEVETDVMETETESTNSVPVTESIAEDQTEPTGPPEIGVLEPINNDPIRVVSPVTPANSNGFKAVLLTLLGNYDPIVYDYTYQTNNQYYSHSITIQEDYPWLCGAAIFSIVLYCVFRMIGGIFIGKR